MPTPPIAVIVLLAGLLTASIGLSVSVAAAHQRRVLESGPSSGVDLGLMFFVVGLAFVFFATGMAAYLAVASW